jgi:hypothetical protein
MLRVFELLRGRFPFWDLLIRRPKPMVELLGTVPRRDVVLHYLELQRAKGDQPLGSLSAVDWEDTNAIEAWLGQNGFKSGILSGFRSWAFVRMSKAAVLETAVVAEAEGGRGGRLGQMLASGTLAEWTPDRPTTWWHLVADGTPPGKELALIVRPALPGEKARWYVEDGTGRAMAAATRLPKDAWVYAYIGFDPESSSRWLTANLGGYFVRNANRYRTFEEACA